MSQLDPNTGLMTDPPKTPVSDLMRASRQVNPTGATQDFMSGLDRESQQTDIPLSHLEKSWWQGRPGTLPSWITYDQALEQQAEGQGFWQKATNGLLKFGAKVPLYMGTAIANLPYGITSAILDGSFRSFFDNELTQGSAELDEKLMESLPHLYTRKQRNEVLGGASNFIFDTLLGAAAFTTAAILTAQTGSFLSNISGMTGLATRVFTTAARAGRMNTAKALTKKQLINQYRQAKNVIQTGRTLDTTGAFIRNMGAGAGFEATIEAVHMMEEATEEFIADFQSTNNRQPNAQEVADFQEQTLSGPSNAVFLANLAIVGTGNAMVFPKIFGMGAIKNPLAKHVVRDSSKPRTFKNALNEWSKLKTNSTITGKILARGAAEGFWEEGSQGIASGTALKYLAAARSPEALSETSDLLHNLIEAAIEQYTSVEGWREMLAGIFIGALGSPAANVNKSGYWTGGFNEIIKNHKETQAEVDKLVSIANNTVKRVEGFVRSSEINAMGKEALDQNNIMDYKDSEFLDLFNYVENALQRDDYSGAVEDLINMVKETTPEEFTTAFGYDSNLSAEEIEVRKQEVIDSFKGRAESIREAYMATRGISPNDMINNGIAVTIASENNIKERFLTLFEELNEGYKTGEIKPNILERIFADNVRANRVVDYDDATANEINKIFNEKFVPLMSRFTGKEADEVSLGDFMSFITGEAVAAFEDSVIKGDHRKGNELAKELNKLIKEEYSKRKKGGTLDKVYNQNYEQFRKDYLASLDFINKTEAYFENNPGAPQEYTTKVQDLAKLAAKRQDLIGQYNRLMTPEGQQEFEETLDEITAHLDLFADKELAEMYNPTLVQAGSVATIQSIKAEDDTAADYQMREFANIGHTINKENIEAGSDFNNVPMLKELRDYIIKRLEENEKEILADDPVATKHKKARANIKIYEELIDYLENKFPQKNQTKIKNLTTEARKSYNEYTSNTIDELKKVLKSNEDILNLTPDAPSPTKGGQVFSTLSNLLRLTTDSKMVAVAAAIGREMTETGLSRGEVINKNVKLVIEDYKGDDTTAVQVQGVTMNRGFVNQEGELKGLYAYYTMPNGESVPIGALYDFGRLEFNGQPVNKAKFGKDRDYTLTVMKAMNSEEVMADRANNFENVMNIAQNYSDMMEMFDNKIKPLSEGEFKLSDLGFNLEHYRLLVTSGITTLAKPVKLETKLEDSEFVERTKIRLGNSEYHIVISRNIMPDGSSYISKIFLARPQMDFETGESTLNWFTPDILEAESSKELDDLLAKSSARFQGTTSQMMILANSPFGGVEGLIIEPTEVTSQDEIGEIAQFGIDNFKTNYENNKNKTHTQIEEDKSMNNNLMEGENTNYFFKLQAPPTLSSKVLDIKLLHDKKNRVYFRVQVGEKSYYEYIPIVIDKDGTAQVVSGPREVMKNYNAEVSTLNNNDNLTLEQIEVEKRKLVKKYDLQTLEFNDKVLLSRMQSTTERNVALKSGQTLKGVKKSKFLELAHIYHNQKHRTLAELFEEEEIEILNQNKEVLDNMKVFPSTLDKAVNLEIGSKSIYEPVHDDYKLTMTGITRGSSFTADNLAFEQMELKGDRENIWLELVHKSFSKVEKTPVKRKKPKKPQPEYTGYFTEENLDAIYEAMENEEYAFANFPEEAQEELVVSIVGGTLDSLPHRAKLLYDVFKGEIDAIIDGTAETPTDDGTTQTIFKDVKAFRDFSDHSRNTSEYFIEGIPVEQLPGMMIEPRVTGRLAEALKDKQVTKALTSQQKAKRKALLDALEKYDVDFTRVVNTGETLNSELIEILTQAVDNINKATSEYVESVSDSLPSDDLVTKVSHIPAEERINMDFAVAELRRMLPDSITTEDISTLVTNLKVKGDLWGAFRDSVIYLSKKAGKGTEYHEAFHAVFRLLLTDNEINTILDQARTKYTAPTKAELKSLSRVHPTLTNKQLSDLFYEEKMADDFMELGNKKAKETWLQRLFNKIKKWLGISNNLDAIDTLFHDIFTGTYKHATVQNNIFTSRNREAVYKVLTKRSVSAPINTKMDTSLFDIKFTVDQSNVIFDTVVHKFLESWDGDPAMRYTIFNEILTQMQTEYIKTGAGLIKDSPDMGRALLEVGAALKMSRNKGLIFGELANRLERELIVENEYEVESEESPENDTDNTGFKKEIRIQGFDKISVMVKRYLSTVMTDTNLLMLDQEGISDFIRNSNNMSLTTSANARFLYNQLIKTFTNTRKNEFLPKLSILKGVDPQVTAFYNKWVSDIISDLGDSMSEAQLMSAPLEVLENSRSFNLIATEFSRTRLTAYDTKVDLKGRAQILLANTRNLAKIMVNSWRVRFHRSRSLVDVEARDNIIKRSDEIFGINGDYLFNELISEVKGANDAKIIDSINDYTEIFINELDSIYGINLPYVYVQYVLGRHLIDNVENFTLPADSHIAKLVSQFTNENINIIDADLLKGIREAVMKDVDIYKEKDSTGQKANIGALSRLYKIAEGSALFDTSVIPTVYTSMEGKSIYDIAYQTYGTRRTVEMQRPEVRALVKDLVYGELMNEDSDTIIDLVMQTFPRKFVSRKETWSWVNQLVNNPIFFSDSSDWVDVLFDNNFELDVMGGIRQDTLELDDEGENLISSKIGANAKNEGRDYSSADIKSRIISLMAMFGSTKEGTAQNALLVKQHQGKERLFFKLKPFTPADASTIPLINMPVISNLDAGYRAMFRAEANRILETNTEIKELYTELQRGNAQALRELSQNLHYVYNSANDMFYSAFVNEDGEYVYFKFGREFTTDDSSVQEIESKEMYMDEAKALPRGLRFMEFSTLYDENGNSTTEIEGQEVEISEQFADNLLANPKDIGVLANNKILGSTMEQSFSEFIDILAEERIIYKKQDSDKWFTRELPNNYRLEPDTAVSPINMNELRKYYFSSYIGAFGYSTLIFGDSSRNAKNPTDFVKRIKRSINGGPNFGSGKTRMIIQKDSLLSVSDTVDTDSPVNRADAQSRSTIMWHFTRIISRAKGLNTKEVTEIYKKLHRGMAPKDQFSSITKEESELLKRSRAAHQPNKTLGVSLSTYLKTSVAPILREDVSYFSETNRETLNELYDELQDIIFDDFNWYNNLDKRTTVRDLYAQIHSYWRPIPGQEVHHAELNMMELDTIDVLARESGIKGDTGRIHVLDNNNNWYFTKIDGENSIEPTEIWDEDLAEILITDGFKTKGTDGTQKQNLIWSEQSDIDAQNNPVEVNVYSAKTSPTKLATEYRKALANRVTLGLNRKLNELKLVDPNTGQITDVYGYKNIMKMFVQTLEDSNADANTIAYFRSEAGRPRYSLNYPTIEPKFQSMFLAYLSKNTLNHKAPSNKLTLLSDAETDFIRDKEGKVIPKGIKGYKSQVLTLLSNLNDAKRYAGANKTRLKHYVKYPDGKYYAEAVLSEEYLFQYGYTYKDFLDGKVPEKLLTFHGIRIPTQDKHSMVNMKAVDFMPASHGNAIMVPAEITALAGSDFDIDALYTRIFGTYNVKNEKRMYGDYLKYSGTKAVNRMKVEVANDLKIPVSEVDRHLPTAYKQIVESNIEAYKEGRIGDIKSFTLSEANNHLLETELSLSVNDGNLDINKTPATLEALKALEEKYYKSNRFKLSSKITGIYSMANQVKAEKGVQNGGRNIGVSALFNTLLQMLSRNNVSIKGADKFPILNGRKFTLTTEGKRNNDIMSTLVTASTDDVKEQQSVLWNFTPTSITHTMISTSLGVPFDSAVLISKMPLIADTIRRTKGSRDNVISAKKQSKSFTLALEAMLSNYNEVEDLEDSTILFKPHFEESLAKAIEERESGVSDENITDQTLKVEKFIIKTVLELEDINTTTFAMSQIMQLIQGIKESFEVAEDLELHLKTIGYKFNTKGELVKIFNNPVDVRGFIEDPFVQAQLKAYYKMSNEVAKNYLLSRTPIFKGITNEMSSLYTNYLGTLESTRKEAKNSLVGFLTVKALQNTTNTFSPNNYSLANLISSITTEGVGHLNLMQQKIEDLRRNPEFRDNKFLNDLVTFNNITYYNPLNSNTHRSHPLYGKTLHLIEGNTRNLKDGNYLQRLMEDFTQLAISDNTDAKSLIVDLLGYLMIKDSFSYRNKSFVKQIDPELLLAPMNIMKKLEQAFSEENISEIEALLGTTLDNATEEFIERTVVQSRNMANVTPVYQDNINAINKKSSEIKEDITVDEVGIIEEVTDTQDIKSEKVVESIAINENQKVRAINLFANNKFGFNLRSIADLFETTIEKFPAKDKFAGVKFPKYTKFIYRFESGMETVPNKLLAVNTIIPYKGKAGYANVVIDTNGFIIDSLGELEFKVPKGVSVGTHIREYTDVYNPASILGTQAYYGTTETVNFNMVDLYGITQEEFESLKKLPRTLLPAISASDVKNAEMPEAPVVENKPAEKVESTPDKPQEASESNELKEGSLVDFTTMPVPAILRLITNVGVYGGVINGNPVNIITAPDGTSIAAHDVTGEIIDMAAIQNAIKNKKFSKFAKIVVDTSRITGRNDETLAYIRKILC